MKPAQVSEAERRRKVQVRLQILRHFDNVDKTKDNVPNLTE